MKNKIFIILLTMTISISLCACGKSNNESANNDVKNPTTETITQNETIAQEESTTEIETTSQEESTAQESTVPNTNEDTKNTEESTIEEETSSIEETSNISTESTYTISESDMTMYTVKGCNIRQGASTEYDVIGTLSKGEAVKVTGKVNEVSWYEISYGEGKGYVSGSLLVSEKPAEEQVPSQPEQPAQPPQQPSQPEQPASSSNSINPNTGQTMKPGESYVDEDGVRVSYVTDDFLNSLFE